MSEDQLEFFEQSEFTVNPDPNRDKPRLWIEHLIIWEKPNEVKREVLLRPGLNIIWTPDESAGGEFFPHDRGKTLLCRLIRYCLGEKNYGTKEQEDLLRHKFSAGAVGANIIIDGTSWSVVRAFNPARTTFVLQNGDLKTMWNGTIDPNYQGVEVLIAEITTKLLGDTPKLMPPGLGNENAWATVLSWVTRDNDDDFREVTSWRHSESQSGSPVVRSSAADRTLAIRAILGALNAEEVPIYQGIKGLETKREADNNTHAFDKRFFARRVQELAREMEMGDISDVEELKRKARACRRKALSARNAAGDVLVAARERFSTLESLLIEKQTLVSVKAILIKEKNSRLKSITLSKTDSTESSRINDNFPCTAWNISVAAAAERGCQLAKVHTSFEMAGEEAELKRLENEKSEAEEEVKSLQQTFESLKREVGKLEREAAKKADELRRWGDLKDRADNLDAPSDEAEDSAATPDVLKWQLSKFQKQAAGNLKTLSDRFHDICMVLAPNAYNGTVKLETDRLELSLNTGGKGNTKATKALKVIAFDLTAMVMSIQRPTCFPGFLVHDAPRVGELCSNHYNKIFRFVRMLESPKKNDSLFQYIICTTTDPPKELQGSDYVCLKMFGPLPHGYLFKTDL